MRNLKTKPIRILHVLRGMNRGGVETWLMHVLKNIDRERYRFDFLTHTLEKCAFDDDLKKMGCRIIPCLEPHRPFQYAQNFKRIISEYGPYDVVHCHVHHYSGFVCWLARRAKIQMVIAHSHNDTTPKESNAWFARKIYLHWMKYLVRKYATHGLACSGKAAQSLFGTKWQTDPRWRVLYYGIDLEPFAAMIDKNQVRSEFGFSPDAFVMGHVGSFTNQKNHEFLLDVMAAMIREDSKIYALLIGSGEARAAMEEKARRLGIEKHVVFAGLRSDIPRVMVGGIDAFVFPSLYEGLGLVLIEAQASGLPCFISDGIPGEADVIEELVTRLSLSDGPHKWAKKIVERKNLRNALQQNMALEKIKHSPFNIRESIRKLEAVYTGF